MIQETLPSLFRLLSSSPLPLPPSLPSLSLARPLSPSLPRPPSPSLALRYSDSHPLRYITSNCRRARVASLDDTPLCFRPRLNRVPDVRGAVPAVATGVSELRGFLTTCDVSIRRLFSSHCLFLSFAPFSRPRAPWSSRVLNIFFPSPCRAASANVPISPPVIFVRVTGVHSTGTPREFRRRRRVPRVLPGIPTDPTDPTALACRLCPFFPPFGKRKNFISRKATSHASPFERFTFRMLGMSLLDSRLRSR